MSGVFPALGLDDVLYTTAGVRALVRRAGTESSVSRMHRIVDGAPLAPPGMISVLGGKITGYRAIAEEVTDLVCRHVGASNRRCGTAETPLPGGAPRAPAGSEREEVRAPVTSRLYDLYGSRIDRRSRARRGASRPRAAAFTELSGYRGTGRVQRETRALRASVRFPQTPYAARVLEGSGMGCCGAGGCADGIRARLGGSTNTTGNRIVSPRDRDLAGVQG